MRPKPCAHRGQHGLRHRQQADDVQLQDLAELGRVDLVERSAEAGPGVVDQPVDAPVPIEGGGHQVAHLRGVGHVGGDGERAVELRAQQSTHTSIVDQIDLFARGGVLGSPPHA
jgi:hypothetical protein